MKNIFSTEALADWLETQEPEGSYCYISDNCLLSRYFRAIGLPVKGVGGDFWLDEMGANHDLSPELNKVAVQGPYTYKAALKRARLAA